MAQQGEDADVADARPDDRFYGSRNDDAELERTKIEVDIQRGEGTQREESSHMADFMDQGAINATEEARRQAALTTTRAYSSNPRREMRNRGDIAETPRSRGDIAASRGRSPPFI